MELKEIEGFISKIPDHPKPGILFYDISTLILNNQAFSESLRLMCESVSESEIDLIAGIDARGFIFASGLACKLNKGLVMLRKKINSQEKLFRKNMILNMVKIQLK